MGRRSKAATTQLNNLKKSKTHLNPILEDVFNDDDEGINFEEDNILDSEEDIFGENSDSDDSEDELGEDEPRIQSEADIEQFNAILFEAQAMAVKAEREAAGKKPKRK
jgi:hypothetical protein